MDSESGAIGRRICSTLLAVALGYELIRHWKPWERSTGPKTIEGKARVSRNAYKGGARALLRELARMLR